jgi:hypothetical protein
MSSHKLLWNTKEEFSQTSLENEAFPQTSLEQKGGVPTNFSGTQRRSSRKIIRNTKEELLGTW